MSRTRQNRHRRARVARARIIEALGAACACCGEASRAALTMDHRRGDGAAERRKFPDVLDLYRHIIAAGIPRHRYQVLCKNCHETKNARHECPHEAAARRILGLDRQGAA